MNTVWKFNLSPGDESEIEMPVGAKVLMAGEQNGVWCLWASVDPDAMKERRLFRITGTGHPIPDGVKHIASFQQPPFVWHVWESLK